MDGAENVNYNDPVTLEKVKKQMEYVINRTLDVWEQGEEMSKDADFYNKALGWLGIKYDLDTNGKVVITDMSSLVKGLKVYQVEGKLMRDARSGNLDAKRKLSEERGKRTP